MCAGRCQDTFDLRWPSRIDKSQLMCLKHGKDLQGDKYARFMRK